jgi:hypothetical protein
MLGVVLHTRNPSTWEVDAGGLQIQGQCGLSSKTLSQINMCICTICLCPCLLHYIYLYTYIHTLITF